MPERCPRCGSTHDSLDGVAVHAWKTQDDAHDDIESKDEGMRVAVAEEYSPDDQPDDDPPADGDSDSPDSDGTANSNADSGLGLDGPPKQPETDSQDDSSTDTAELSCGCEVSTTDLEPGQYRCKTHGTEFTYNP
jgi:hypothetical protein